MHIVIVDCEDSFTLNIYDYLKQAKVEKVDVLLHSQCSIKELEKYDAIVLSPGPKSPEDIPLLRQILEVYAGNNKPILGICLGHQAIGQYYGHSISKSEQPMHGISTRIVFSEKKLLDGIDESAFFAMRYNSLTILDKENSDLNVSCRDEQGEIMGFQHKTLPIFSFQFHPESVGTPQGLKLLQNWILHIQNYS